MKMLLCAYLLLTFIPLSFAGGPSDIKRACDELSKKLERPTIPTQTITIGRFVNPFIPPEVKSECTGTYDTGVPDMSTCRMVDGGTSRSCAQVPYCDVGWGGVNCGTREQCITQPNAPRTVCSNIIACNTYKTEKRFNECRVSFKLKVPNFIAEPINKYIDSAYNTIESARNEVRSALPLACATEDVQQTVGSQNIDYGRVMAEAVTNEIKDQLTSRLKREGEAWIARTGVETILASIPSGGIGGAAALGTNIADFIITAKNIADDYVQIKEVKTFAEDMEFELTCGPGEWSRL